MTCPVHAFTDGQCCDDARDCVSTSVRLERITGANKRRAELRAIAEREAYKGISLAGAFVAVVVFLLINFAVAESALESQDTINQEILNHD